MRITTKGRYALRAMTNLAVSNSDRPKAIKQIAGEEDISPEFLEQIFFKLKKHGIIGSVRGPGGGFVLNKEPETITVREIFDAVGEGLDLTPCTAEHTDPEGACARMDDCLVYDVWKEASRHIIEYFDRLTLRKIMDDHKHHTLDPLLQGRDVTV